MSFEACQCCFLSEKNSFSPYLYIGKLITNTTSLVICSFPICNFDICWTRKQVKTTNNKDIFILINNLGLNLIREFNIVYGNIANRKQEHHKRKRGTKSKIQTKKCAQFWELFKTLNVLS